MDIAKHIEDHLGPISWGWKEKSASDLPQVVAVKNEPWDGVTTFSSLGLSSHVLHLPSNKDVRQEFIFGDTGQLSTEFVTSLILWMCECALESQTAVSRGQTIRLPGEMTKSASFKALYCAIPVVYEDALATFAKSDPATVFVWLVPIKGPEADYVESNGWDKFEELLEERDPDLFDTARASIV